MKAKQLFDFSSNGAAKKEAVSLPAPIARRIRNAAAVMERNPKRTIAAMLLIASLNFGVFLWVNGKTKKGDAFSDFAKAKSKAANPGSFNVPDIDFNVSTYFELKEIKDSLEILMRKQSKTSADKQAFIRLLDKYSNIDKQFQRDLENSLKNKQP